MSKAGARARSGGYTFAAVLVVLIAIAMAMQVTYVPPKNAKLRNQEAELIFRGLAIRRALASYYALDPANPALPSTLDDLVDDERADGHRHLRFAYVDPISGDDWVLIHSADGNITGVASPSTDRPRKTGIFPPGLDHFSAATSYAEWTFIFEP